ncbi:MAG: RusA family crossover junction endodeoxyribonuclease, partial [Pseudomonadota bacterium]
IRAATTQTRRLKTMVRAACRREAGARRPSFAPFDVRIWTSLREEARGAHDVDNIAKACLDALSGVLWKDDRQVVRLRSERFIGDANQIAVLARPLAGPLAPVDLDETLFDVD